MKAIVYHTYGPPDVLHCEEVEKPIAGDTEVLLRVRAASVNPLDWHFIRGEPYIMRAATGLSKPKDNRPGVDLAGQVEAVGKNVTQLQPGDEVFGTCSGAFAEYVCVEEKKLVRKPANLTFEEAAAVPVAGLTALQGLRDKGRLQPGQKVLINGAAGGVGTFAVQIAKIFGAEVTGVCSTRNVDLIRSLGADHAIDYTQEDFTRGRQRYDLMLDCMGNRPLSACRRILGAGGTYVMVGGPTGRWFGPLGRFLQVLLASRLVNQNLALLLTSPNREDLAVLKEFLEAKKLRAIIDRCYTLREVPEAIRYLEPGHARGKVVITVEQKHDT